MFKSKLNLYNTEWLDLVFSDRNKNYGAYELRKHYNSNLLKSLFFTATLFSAGIFIVSVLVKQHPDPMTISKTHEEVLINLTEIAPPPVSHEKQVVKKALPASGAAQKAVAMLSQVYKPVADNLVKDEPKPVTALNTITGTQDLPVDIAGLNAPAGGSGNGTDNGTANKPDNGVKTVGMLEKSPEFPGGMEGWSKFLSKNLRYPEQASQAGVSGRVLVSFIVEKDGHITDIQVLKAAGYGFDEEAKRVLKMAPMWKPGIQNGQAVRVRYTIPINFTISE